MTAKFIAIPLALVALLTGNAFAFPTEMAKTGLTIFLIKHAASGMPLDSGSSVGYTQRPHGIHRYVSPQ